MTSKPITKVVFYKFIEDDDIIAVFPEQPYLNYDDGCVVSYMHNGQHGAATREIGDDPTLVSLATEGEYASLKKELESIGYVLEVI